MGWAATWAMSVCCALPPKLFHEAVGTVRSSSRSSLAWYRDRKKLRRDRFF